MLNKMATNIAQFYYTVNDSPYDEDDVEVLAYGFELLVSSVIEAIAILIIGAIFGRILETLAFFAAFIPLRTNAGGYHARTHIKCFICVLIIYTVFLVLQFTIPYWIINCLILTFAIVSAIPILLFAPLPDVNKPIGPIQRKQHRKISVILYIIQVVIIIGLSITGFTPYIALGFAFGQLSASGSLVAARVRDFGKGGETREC